MKKEFKFIGIIALVAVIGFSMTACDNGKTDPVLCACEIKVHPEPCACGGEDCDCIEETQFRETTIELTFGEDIYTAKVQGTLTQTQWNGSADKIRTALESAYNLENKPGSDIPDAVYQGWFTFVFGGGLGVTIIVEKVNNEEYAKWKTLDTGKTLYINIDSINSLPNLGSAILALRSGLATNDLLIGLVGGIPVYRTADVSIADAEATLALLRIVWSSFEGGAGETKVTNKVKTIKIISGNAVILNGNSLEIGTEADEETIGAYIWDDIILAE